MADSDTVRRAGPVGVPAAAALTPKEAYGILRRHVFLIIGLTLLGFIVAAVLWYLLLQHFPKYTAQTYIRVLSPVEKDPMTIGGRLAGEDIQYSHRLSMASLITQQSTLESLLGRDRVRQTQWFRRFGESSDESVIKGVKDLEENLRVYAQRNGEYIEVSMTCGDDEEAALIVNEMVRLFLTMQGSDKQEDIAEKLTRLREQQLRLQRELDSAELALGEVRERWGITDLEEHDFQHTITQKLNDLQQKQDDLVLQIREVQSIIETLERQATGPINEQIEHQVETDPVMIMLAQQRVLQESRLAGDLTRFGENHKEVRQSKQFIEEIKRKRAQRKQEIAEQTRQSNLQNAQDQFVAFESKLEELKQMRTEAEAKKSELDLARVQYEQRVSIRDERKDRLDEVKSQIEKLNIMHDDPETPKVQFVGDAPVPLEVSSPRWEFYLPGGTVVGLLFAVALAFCIELLNDLVRTPRDVARYLHIPLLGVIPDAAEDERVGKADLCQVVRQSPYSIVSESYRRFRTNLALSVSGKACKVLLVSSGGAADGKTSVAVNLATSFVAENKKVLLIDANFRRARLHNLFPKTGVEASEQRSEFGLSNMLMGQCEAEQIVRPSGVEALDVIDAGALPPNPAELLGGARMAELIGKQRQRYDHIIVDGPPVLLVSDAKTLASVVDATVLVFNAKTTRRGAALRAIREIREVDVDVIGCVLFEVRAMKGGYFTEQYKSYELYQQPQPAGSI